MKIIISVFFIGAFVPVLADTPTLHFHDSITWKQIFDSGFRPKHLEGLERNTCVSHHVGFKVQFRDRSEKFDVDGGRIRYTFFKDDFLNMIWHQGREPITLEQGRIRVEEFRKVFEGYVVQEMTMPRVVDPSGVVDAGNEENNIRAEMGDWFVTYGFDNSMRIDRPLIQHLYIAWRIGRNYKLKDFGDFVRPPQGYEWYSLDPKIDTPDPGRDPVKALSANQAGIEAERAASRDVKMDIRDHVKHFEDISSLGFFDKLKRITVLLLIVLSLVGMLKLRYWIRRRSDK